MIRKTILFCMFSCVIASLPSIDPPDFAPLAVATAGDEQRWKRSTLGSIEYVLHCKDLNSHCSGFAQRGECAINPIYMNLHCQDSCKVCHVGDKSLYCGYWARRGECTKHPAIMGHDCVPSCFRYMCQKSGDDRVQKFPNDVVNRKQERRNYSKDPPDFAPLAVATADDEQHWKRSTPGSIGYVLHCKDLNSHCSGFAQRGECVINPIYMNLHCQDSCKVCHVGDKSLYCGYWARRGECTKNPAYMGQNCVPSCSRYHTFVMQSMNYKKYYVGMKNGNEAWIIEYPSQNPFMQLLEVKGLVYQNPVKTTAIGRVVSFKWKNDFYLRHRGYKFYFHQPPPVNDVTALHQFNKDASFIITEDGEYFRLEAVNRPGYFMRHDAFRLWLEKETQGQLFKEVSNFKKIFLN